MIYNSVRLYLCTAFIMYIVPKQLNIDEGKRIKRHNISDRGTTRFFAEPCFQMCN